MDTPEATVKIPEPMKPIKGIVTIRSYQAGTVDRANPFARWIREAKKAREKIIIDMRDRGHDPLCAQLVARFDSQIEEMTKIMRGIFETGFIRTELVKENLVVVSSAHGKDLIVQRLAGINTYSLNILFGEIGTGSTAPTNADVALTTPTNRAAVAFQQDFGNNTAIVQFFFTDGTLTNQTYNEFGTFVDGSASVGSGQMFNHALFSPGYAKVIGQDTTVEVDFLVS